MDYEIHYAGYPKVLEGCSDSNWISDADEIKATSGYIGSPPPAGSYLEVVLFPESLASRQS
jgi:hypothetical protein